MAVAKPITVSKINLILCSACSSQQVDMSVAIDTDSAQRHDSDSELLGANTCPICLCKKSGKNLRHQLIMHFRRALDAEHKQFQAVEYKKHFKVGRSRSPVTFDGVYKAIEKRFGRDVAQRYVHSTIV